MSAVPREGQIVVEAGGSRMVSYERAVDEVDQRIATLAAAAPRFTTGQREFLRRVEDRLHPSLFDRVRLALRAATR